MFVELTLPDGTIEDVNVDAIRSMRGFNLAPPESQPEFVTAITFISGKTERYRGNRHDIKAAFKQAGVRW